MIPHCITCYDHVALRHNIWHNVMPSYSCDPAWEQARAKNGNWSSVRAGQKKRCGIRRLLAAGGQQTDLPHSISGKQASFLAIEAGS